MKKKCCFIIPYFGKLPKNFSVFLKTCETNSDFDWLLLTDDSQKFIYPQNVKVKYTTLKDISERAEQKFGFCVELEHAYKLCDFKPAYGFIFEEYIKDYEFWGHCDIDTIMGNLSHFLTDDVLEKYDKLFCMGHMVIYRNSNRNNRVFMKNYKGKELYKKVFTTPKICWFDEEWNGENNINQIFLKEGKNVLIKDWSANFNVNKQNFVRNIFYEDKITGQVKHKSEKDIDALYYWENGGAYRIYIKEGKLIKEEFLYMHFQWRNMKFNKKILGDNKFKIVPNSFLCIKKIPITIEEFKKIRKKTICFYTFERWIKNHITRRLKKITEIIFKDRMVKR